MVKRSTNNLIRARAGEGRHASCMRVSTNTFFASCDGQTDTDKLSVPVIESKGHPL